MSSYLTIRKNEDWVIYWSRNDEVYETWYDSLSFTNGDWVNLKLDDVGYVLAHAKEDLNKRKETVLREQKIYSDLLAAHAALPDIQKQAYEVAQMESYMNELAPVIVQLQMLYTMIEQSGDKDVWDWSIG